MIRARHRGIPGWALAPVAALVALVLLLEVVSVGLRLRGTGGIGPLPPSAELDYASGRFGAFAPLTSAFIRDVLGGVIEPPGGVIGEQTAVPPLINVSTDVPPRLEVVHELTNDDRADARTIPSVPYTARTNTTEATLETGEPTCGTGTGGSVWYRYTPRHDIGLIANTFGTNYSTTLGVYSDGGQSQALRCDTDVNGDALLQFVAQAGTTYFFQIVGPARGGDLVFNLDPEGVTTLESKGPDGDQGDAASHSPSTSGDGRFVAFESEAEDLTRTETYRGTAGIQRADIFIRDRVEQATSLVSVSSSGGPANDSSTNPWISGNGRVVAFQSVASNMVERDTNGACDVFVRDLVLGRTERVSVSSSGEQLRDPGTGFVTASYSATQVECQMFPSMSYDGRYVAFQSAASNLVDGDHNGSDDVFVHDRETHTTERVSVDPLSREAEGGSTFPSISGNGRVVSFLSTAENLASNDGNLVADLFVHDRVKRTTERITAAPIAANVNDDDQPYYPMSELGARQFLSFDGRYVTFAASPFQNATPLVETHVFVYDRKTRRPPEQVDVSSDGERAENGLASRGPAISTDGRFIAFFSRASNLVDTDDNRLTDVFVRDLKTRTTIRLTGTPARDGLCENCGAFLPSISANGHIVAFNTSFLDPLARGSSSDQEQIYVNDRSGARK